MIWSEGYFFLRLYLTVICYSSSGVIVLVSFYGKIVGLLIVGEVICGWIGKLGKIVSRFLISIQTLDLIVEFF